MVEICTDSNDRRNPGAVCNYRDPVAQAGGNFAVNHQFF